MAKKHILDIDEDTWRDIKRFKLDFLDDRGNINDALLILLKRGMLRTIEGYQMMQEQMGERDNHHIGDHHPKEAPAGSGQEMLVEVGGRTSNVRPPGRPPNGSAKARIWGPEKMAKLKRELAEKHGVDVKVAA